MINFLKINPNIGKTIATTAGARAALAAAQRANPSVVRAAQRLFQAFDLGTQLFGGAFEDAPLKLMGGMTPKMVMEQQRAIRGLNPAHVNRWYIRVTDLNPPDLKRPGESGGFPRDVNVSTVFDLLAQDVSYGPSTVQADKVNIGSAVLDRPNGTEAVELQITTLDDEWGTLKRWFDAKSSQVAAEDGTFGVPNDYCITIEVVHGLSSPDIERPQGAPPPYRLFLMMRPGSINHELTRKEDRLAEVTMTFQQFDTFYKAS